MKHIKKSSFRKRSRRGKRKFKISRSLKSKNGGQNNLKTLIIICSKSPNDNLYNCVEELYKIQMNDNTKICIVDSDSDNFDNYNKVKEKYPSVDIQYAKNKNYEYGAYKYAYNLYPNYDIYICIQDTLICTKKIDLTIVDNNNAYIYFHFGGFAYNTDKKPYKQYAIKLLEGVNLNYKDIIDTPFNLSTHNSFIVNKHVMKNIFETLVHPPINKDDSCAYERIFGLYFILKNIKTHELLNYFTKIYGGRV
jgi:hypothetical protein